MIGPEAGEVMAVVQMAMLAGLPYTALRDAILTHPTTAEGLNSLFPATLQAKVDDLIESLMERDRSIDEQQELLAHDRDIRELMGARDLYMPKFMTLPVYGSWRRRHWVASSTRKWKLPAPLPLKSGGIRGERKSHPIGATHDRH